MNVAMSPCQVPGGKVDLETAGSYLDIIGKIAVALAGGVADRDTTLSRWEGGGRAGEGRCLLSGASSRRGGRRFHRMPSKTAPSRILASLNP